jgi:NAD(P)-dependent dehydrogenase (short-subunit alcohol dehydrogenase family)
MKRIFITGSSDGLGLLAAKALVSMGHKVVIHARNEDRAKSALKEVPGAEKVIIGDLSGIEETKNIALQVNELGNLNAIIHNAGIYNVPEKAKSKDGLPLLFAVNSLAPYLLTALISKPNRLIYLSSGLHMQGNASIDRLTAIVEGKNYPGYSDTKLHDLLLALAVARKWPEIYSNAVNPGWVPTKMGGRNAPDDLQKGFETQVWLAIGQDKEALQSGRLLYHKKEINFNPQGKIEEIQEKFLSISEQLSGVPFPD